MITELNEGAEDNIGALKLIFNDYCEKVVSNLFKNSANVSAKKENVVSYPTHIINAAFTAATIYGYEHLDTKKESSITNLKLLISVLTLHDVGKYLQNKYPGLSGGNSKENIKKYFETDDFKIRAFFPEIDGMLRQDEGLNEIVWLIQNTELKDEAKFETIAHRTAFGKLADYSRLGDKIASLTKDERYLSKIFDVLKEHEVHLVQIPKFPQFLIRRELLKALKLYWEQSGAIPFLLFEDGFFYISSDAIRPDPDKIKAYLIANIKNLLNLIRDNEQTPGSENQEDVEETEEKESAEPLLSLRIDFQSIDDTAILNFPLPTEDKKNIILEQIISKIPRAMKGVTIALPTNGETQKKLATIIYYVYKNRDLNRLPDEKFRGKIESLKKKYLFNWDKVPGNDSRKLMEFLTQQSDMAWIKTAKIEKIDNGRVIKVSTEKNYLSLKLNDKKTKVSLELDNRRDELIVKQENDKLNIYEKGETQKYKLYATKELVETYDKWDIDKMYVLCNKFLNEQLDKFSEVNVFDNLVKNITVDFQQNFETEIIPENKDELCFLCGSKSEQPYRAGRKYFLQARAFSKRGKVLDQEKKVCSFCLIERSLIEGLLSSRGYSVRGDYLFTILYFDRIFANVSYFSSEFSNVPLEPEAPISTDIQFRLGDFDRLYFILPLRYSGKEESAKQSDRIKVTKQILDFITISGCKATLTAPYTLLRTYNELFVNENPNRLEMSLGLHSLSNFDELEKKRQFLNAIYEIDRRKGYFAVQRYDPLYFIHFVKLNSNGSNNWARDEYFSLVKNCFGGEIMRIEQIAQKGKDLYSNVWGSSYKRTVIMRSALDAILVGLQQHFQEDELKTFVSAQIYKLAMREEYAKKKEAEKYVTDFVDSLVQYLKEKNWFSVHALSSIEKYLVDTYEFTLLSISREAKNDEYKKMGRFEN